MDELKDIPVWTEHNRREKVYDKRLKDALKRLKPKKIHKYKENGLVITVYEGR